MAKDLYETLGLNRNASDEEIKKAYRRLTQKYHPDKKDGDEAKFKEVNSAYQVLSDKTKKQQYDQFGQTFDGAGGAGASGFQGNPFSGGFSGMGGMNFEGVDIDDLGDIFGNMFHRGESRQGARVRKGPDIAVDAEISFEEMVSGVKKEFKLYKNVQCDKCNGTGAELGSGTKKCSDCGGTGRKQTTRRTILGSFAQVVVCPTCEGAGEVADKKCSKCRGIGSVKEYDNIAIEIPPGVESGETLVARGKGEAGGKNSVAGDLYIRITVKPHKDFKREGSNVYYKLPISFTEAALGYKADVPTVDGSVEMKIVPGTQSGTILRLQGKGLPQHYGGRRGDQFVEVQVVVPRKVSRKGKRLLEELESEL